MNNPSVYLCSPTNSTTFTTCCRIAICEDQLCCPVCRREVIPAGHARFSMAYRKSLACGFGPYNLKWPKA